METSINNKCKAFTSLEQSKKLAEILPFESADMHYVRKTHDFMGNPVDGKWSHPKYGNPNSKHANYIIQNFESYERIPCWSLAALLKVIPKTFSDLNGTRNVLRMDYSYKDFAIWYDKMSFGVDSELPDIIMESPVDACVKMILELKENNLL